MSDDTPGADGARGRGDAPDGDDAGGAVDPRPHPHGDRAYEWVGSLSARRARLSPDRVAVTDTAAGEEYTYAELDERANRTARFLRDVDVGSGDRVAVVSRNRVELLDLFFATAKVGAVLAPLSHRLAERELAAVLGDVDPALLAVETPFEGDAVDALERADVEPPVRAIATDGDSAWRTLGDDLPDDGSPVETAAVSLADPHLFLHTGGSTGTPKETVISHGAIRWNAFNTITAWGLREDDVTPMVFPMFHTGGWNVLTVPFLQMGARILLSPEVDPGRVLADVEREDATTLVAVPAVLRMMARHDEWAETDLSSLRFVKSGGGPCRESVIDAWRDRGVEISQGYGLTECGPNNFAMPDGFPPEKTASVGVPALAVDARVVDEDGPVPSGTVGELELAGPAAADRYWNNAEETAETFGDWVSTGDLARVDADGYYHIEGRKKNMFVSGGENVYPPRVEDALTDHPGIEEAVVIGVPSDEWGTVGKAVLVGDESLTLDDLRSHLASRVARYAVPKELAFVDEMPTSGPSKIDRTAIKDRFGK
ncbi:AMP-binding protein [Halorubrum sp. CBA1229]|uniref:AMP-binding protein n=1 Tax=Halorubrum sp. CBA1229 TaxID=1853699 RepID=UPI000F3E505F|nr:AMP-binding protein [Halorubrum sp. CBA1229]QKY17934.1 AMP-binding protein [Halorubrum sp. CBA1229]